MTLGEGKRKVLMIIDEYSPTHPLRWAAPGTPIGLCGGANESPRPQGFASKTLVRRTSGEEMRGVA